MKNYKKLSIPFLMVLFILAMSSCKKNNGYNEATSKDKTKPDVVTNIKVDNFNGGANITYTLPNNPNILYVLAKYNINDGVARETKTSYYTDTMVVNGFAKEQEYEVTLYTVSRANVMSDPVKVKVNPKTPVYESIKPSLNVSADFGGINVKAANPLKKEIGVIVMSYDDNTKTMEVRDQFYTRAAVIDYSLRGYNVTPRKFSVYITDQWGNKSVPLDATITPLYEEMVDKSGFRAYNIPSDSPIGYNWQLPNLWNDKLDGDGWHTQDGERPPFVCTFGIGKTYKLSRFVLWSRMGDQYVYKEGNVRDFSIWGSNVDAPRDAKLPVLAEEGAVVGDWINLGNYHFPDPPSGLPPGSTNASDTEFVKKGVNFNVPFNAPSVKFLRVAVARSWGNGTVAYIMEMSFFGLPN